MAKELGFLGSKKKRKSKGWKVSFGVCIREGKQREFFFGWFRFKQKKVSLGRERPPEGPFVHFFISFVASLVYFAPRIT